MNTIADPGAHDAAILALTMGGIRTQIPSAEVIGSMLGTGEQKCSGASTFSLSPDLAISADVRETAALLRRYRLTGRQVVTAARADRPKVAEQALLGLALPPAALCVELELEAGMISSMHMGWNG